MDHPDVHNLKTLEQVVRWALMQRPPLEIHNVVHQDEYTLDVIVPLADGSSFVFDAT